MQVTLATIGRFHTFDLARQMHKRGQLKRILTGYPSFKLRNEGLPLALIRSFPWLHAPLMGVSIRPEALRNEWCWQDRIWFDRFVARKLEDCEILHALSGSALRSAHRAKKLGIRYICDRGSSHIRFQNRILHEEFQRNGLIYPGTDQRVMDMEEQEYDLADAITVPSTFALETFVSCGVPREKMRLVPYGVELSRFQPRSRPPSGDFKVLFAGTVSIRKGVLYLLKAFDQLVHSNKSLTLVGAVELKIRPLLRPYLNRADISFTGAVPQPDLAKRMSESHVLVLPSLEEGLALVQAQAMASGCPVIASTNTGAEDLLTDGTEGFITPIRDTNALADCLQRLADDPPLQALFRQRALDRVKDLGGWDHYGHRMNTVFQSVCAPQGVPA